MTLRTAEVFTADEARSTAWHTLYAIWANARTFSGATLPKHLRQEAADAITLTLGNET